MSTPEKHSQRFVALQRNLVPLLSQLKKDTKTHATSMGRWLLWLLFYCLFLIFKDDVDATHPLIIKVTPDLLRNTMAIARDFDPETNTYRIPLAIRHDLDAIHALLKQAENDIRFFYDTEHQSIAMMLSWIDLYLAGELKFSKVSQILEAYIQMEE